MPRSLCSPSGISGCCRFLSEGPGEQHRATERPAQAFQPADQVDGGADGGEIQPVGGADVAPQHFADMQRRAKRQRRQASRTTGAIEVVHAGARGGDCAQRRIACGGSVALADRKDRQHAVADEFQHFAAEGMNRAGDAVEPGVERRDHLLRCGSTPTVR